MNLQRALFLVFTFIYHHTFHVWQMKARRRLRRSFTLIQKVAYNAPAMSFLMQFYLASGAGYAKTSQYILEVVSEHCQNVSIN